MAKAEKVKNKDFLKFFGFANFPVPADKTILLTCPMKLFNGIVFRLFLEKLN